MPVIDGKLTCIAHADGRLSTINLDTGPSVSVDVLFAHPRNQPSASLHQSLGLEIVERPLGYNLKTDDRRQTSLMVSLSNHEVVAFRPPTHNRFPGRDPGVSRRSCRVQGDPRIKSAAKRRGSPTLAITLELF